MRQPRAPAWSHRLGIDARGGARRVFGREHDRVIDRYWRSTDGCLVDPDLMAMASQVVEDPGTDMSDAGVALGGVHDLAQR